MKKIFILILTSAAVLFSFTSCEDFLDKSPDLGLSEDDIVKDFKSIQGFLDVCYTHLEHTLLRGQHGNSRAHVSTFSDECGVTLNKSEAIPIHSGNWLKSKPTSDFEIGVSGNTCISRAIKSIRIVNRVLAEWEKVPMTEEEARKIRGQAHFLRAWNYFQLLKRYGGMPKLDRVFTGDGDQNVPRMTYHASHDWMMEDIQAAIELLPDSWDSNNTGRVTKLAAMAFRSMAQLYDASPLMQNGLDAIEVKGYDKERAKAAAQSAYEAIKYIENPPADVNVRLMGQDEYKHIFYWSYPPMMQPEHIWYNRDVTNIGLGTSNNRQQQSTRSFWLYTELAEGQGDDGANYCCPTQNMVDLYEKKGSDGNYYPISDPRAGYDLQDLFADRDPRFYNNILTPGTEWGKKNSNSLYITTYVEGDSYVYSQNNTVSNGRQITGYLCKKFIWPEANQFTNGWTNYRYNTVYIRVAQVYLDFAEASFEATGSATAHVEGCNMSAADALNIIRRRAGITDLTPDRLDPDKFREAYRQERAVELMFENHRWWDIRRWMIAHELFASTYPIKGLRAVPPEGHKNVSDKSSLQFTFSIIDITTEIRNFQMQNYWYPFTQSDVSSIPSFKQNPGW
ncbi:MAG: RagB/SusD family nutrient uptake outer membrane protein [Alistipes sp.]|uniref:RagB/SusD family nutrient uptake outer membrane protein n=1 Tax=Alistipes sp. TaxID=1872444 RepID=UPI0025C2C2B8|nr:RagB/SusD family nutrient uptake outer membrane protein [Alistipes sp.]MCD8274773.1 RagB/SusD family nutrient uptake outer membrane protein [Alistipes sp.]